MYPTMVSSPSCLHASKRCSPSKPCLVPLASRSWPHTNGRADWGFLVRQPRWPGQLARPRLARPRLEHRIRHHPLADLVLRLGSIHAPRLRWIIRPFQERMPYGLYVPEVPDDLSEQKAPPKMRMQVVGEESGGMTKGKSYGPLRVDVEQSHPISEMTIAHYDRMAEAYWVFDLDTWRNFVRAAGFIEVGHYYRPPGRPCHQQPWLATVWRKG